MSDIISGWDKLAFKDIIVENKKSTLKVSDASNFGDYNFYTSGESVLKHHSPIVDGSNIYLATGGVANVKFENGAAAYSTDTYSVKTKDNQNTKYLYYYLLNSLQYINDTFFQGSGLKHLQKKDLKEYLINIPSDNNEQKKIASILSKVDDAIENTEKLINKYENVKIGIMQDLLTKGIDENGNIRSEETHQFKDSPLGRIPMEWEFSLIGDCCFVTKLSGFEFTKFMKYTDDGEIIALRALNVKNKKIILNDIQRISKSVSDKLSRSKLFIGDILVTYIGAYIGSVAMVDNNDKFHLAPNIAKIVAGKKLISFFLLEMLDSEKVQNYFKSLITTTANPSLTMGQIRNTYIIFPTNKKEQEIISLIIKKNSELVDSFIEKLNNLKNLKKGLMQDLLSGKVRVNN